MSALLPIRWEVATLGLRTVLLDAKHEQHSLTKQERFMQSARIGR